MPPTASDKPPVMLYLSGAPLVSTGKAAAVPGARAHVLGMIHGLEANGWQVQRHIVGDQLRLKRGPTSGAGRNRLRALAVDLVRLALGGWHLLAALRQAAPETCFVYERLATLQALGYAFRWRKIPWVLESNAILYEEAHANNRLLLRGLARIVECFAYRQADLIVCVSEPLRDMIVDRAAVPADKILVLPNAVDTTFFDPETYPSVRPFGDRLTIGFVGGLYAWQALDVLFHAMAQLHRDGLTDIAAVIVGDGPQRDEWQQLVAQLGLAAHVHFAGYVEWGEVQAYINGFDVGYSGQVGATIYFSPLKVYEYLAMATPVIGARYPQIEAVVSEGETGFLFAAGQVQSLCDALRTAYTQQSQLTQFGAQGRARMLADHSWQQRARTLLDTLAALEIIVPDT